MAFIVMDPEESSYMAMEPSYLDQRDGAAGLFRMPLAPGAAVQRNLCRDFEDETMILPQPSPKETVQVFLRVKPKTLEESEISAASGKNQPGEDTTVVSSSSTDGHQIVEEDVIKIESAYQVALKAPHESNTYKNSMNGVGKLFHRYSFSKIFPPQTSQSDLFHDMVLPRMKDFLEGQNQLLFTYGATSSGKTHTIQGAPGDPGILPRSLDVIFNSIGERQLLGLSLKPNCFNRVVQMREKDIKRLEDDKLAVFSLGLELGVQKRKMGCSEASKISGISQLSEDSLVTGANVTNLSSASLVALFPDLTERVREPAVVPIKNDDINYAVWISFAEIYNENIYDMLERMPAPKRKGDKPKKIPLKLAEDRNGSIYVKGLREIKVNSADEAYQVMMIGRENLHFAATKLNQHSSRSHCIFTIKVIRVAETAKPHLARVSMLSFCDLAGSERIKKTLDSGGERQKEAGNINTSLLVLGRCIKAIRHNQVIKEKRKQQLVPFRESKLTRMFQSFLMGYGKASMVVNISQAPYLFDESVQVLKFAAIASKITVQKIESPPPQPAKIAKKRQTRFSLLVDASKKGNNTTLMGRGSIAWEKPAARSTLCIGQQHPTEGTIMEEEENETTVMETTMIDARYDGLLKLIDDLKNQLIQEKQEKLTLEKEVRTELCDEFNAMLVETERNWEKRLQDEKERSEELAEWRINKLEEAYRAKRRGTKRQRSEIGSDADETKMFQQAELEIALEDKETELKCTEEKYKALMETHQDVQREKSKQTDELCKYKLLLEKETGAHEEAKERITYLSTELDKAKQVNLESESAQSATPVIEDLKRQLEEALAKHAVLKGEKENLKELLDEAGEDYLESRSECEKTMGALREQEQQLMKQAVELADLKSQLEESRLLLMDSATRTEEMEKTINDLEEELQVKQAEREQNEQKLREERDRVERELNDEVELEKSSKKKLKMQVEEKAKETEQAEKEILRLEGEVKSLIQAEKQQRQTTEEAQAEVAMLRKQLKDLNTKIPAKGEMEALAKKTSEQENEIEKLRIQVTSLEKEDQAFAILKKELETKMSQKDSLEAKVAALQAKSEAAEYDLGKLKSERDTLMTMYQQKLTKKTEELATEKREAQKMRDLMLTSPAVNKRDLEGEVRMLREELQKKTEFIQKLELMIPAKKSLGHSSNEDESSDDEKATLQGEVARLRKELEETKGEHGRQLEKIRKANDKVVREYRESNLELQKNISAVSASSAATDRSTLEADDDEEEGDDDIIEETPRNKKRRRNNVRPTKTSATNRSKRGGRGGNKTDSASQASFEDSESSVSFAREENDDDDDNDCSTTSPKRRRTTTSRAKSAAKLTRSRPVRRSTRNSNVASAAQQPLRDTANVLDAIAESPPHPSGVVRAAKTPATGSKRKLYSDSGRAHEFTPPTDNIENVMTPGTVVKRQLRLRSGRK